MPSRFDFRLAVIALALVSACAFQGSRGLWETTEGRYAECAREMLVSGDYLEPRVSGEPHWTKPPFTYWAVAGGLGAFGVNTWGARLPVSLAFLLTTLLVGATGRRLWGHREGWLAALVYASSPLPVAGATVVSVDTFLTMWVALGLFAYVNAWQRGGRRWASLFWAAFGMAFLTKGTPALLFLAGIMGFHLHARRPCRIFTVPGGALFLLLGFGWYAIVEIRNPGLLAQLFRTEVVERNLTPKALRNPEWFAPLTVYLPTLLLAGGAFSLWAVRLVRRRGVRGLVERGTAGGLLAWYALVPLVAFAIARSRLAMYLLPLYPAMALGFARAMARVSRRPMRRGLAVAAVTLLVLMTAKAVAPRIPVKRDMARLADQLRTVGGEVWTLREEHLHGLEFYLGRHLRRIRGEPEEMEALRTRAEETRVVIVAYDEAGEWLVEELGWEHEKTGVDWWFLWRGPESDEGAP